MNYRVPANNIKFYIINKKHHIKVNIHVVNPTDSMQLCCDEMVLYLCDVPPQNPYSQSNQEKNTSQIPLDIVNIIKIRERVEKLS